MQSARIGVGEAIDDYEGVAAEEVNKIMEEKEARANAELLEMVSALCGLTRLGMNKMADILQTTFWKAFS